MQTQRVRHEAPPPSPHQIPYEPIHPPPSPAPPPSPHQIPYEPIQPLGGLVQATRGLPTPTHMAFSTVRSRQIEICTKRNKAINFGVILVN